MEFILVMLILDVGLFTYAVYRRYRWELRYCDNRRSFALRSAIHGVLYHMRNMLFGLKR